MAEDLKVISDTQSATSGHNIQQQLFKDMTDQAKEFHRRYTNVKQRNESSDKVISEMKK
jgi:hypothetical protein